MLYGALVVTLLTRYGALQIVVLLLLLLLLLLSIRFIVYSTERNRTLTNKKNYKHKADEQMSLKIRQAVRYSGSSCILD